MSNTRKIIHVDMDAFYASVEQRDHPEWRGKPVIVGGSPEKRGVVCAASYEARPFGVRSAMSARQARQRCPDAIFVRPRFDAYKAVSDQIRAIFLDYTDLVEPLSLDEAYLDVTENKKDNPSATRIAEEIRARIWETTHLTASAGVSYNKLLAKIASDMNKPNGLTLIRPEEAVDVLRKLPIDAYFGVGRVTAVDMRNRGIATGEDLLAWPEESLIQTFGKYGAALYRMARGEDHREVSPERIRKSVGSEHTFASDLTDPAVMAMELDPLLNDVLSWLLPRGLAAKTLTVKIKFHDFRQITRSHSFPSYISDRDAFAEMARRLLRMGLEGPCRVRLLGVQLQNLSEPGEAPPAQMRLALGL